VTLLEAYRSGALTDFHRLAPDAWSAALETTHPADRGALATAARQYLEVIGAPKAALEAVKQLEHPESRVVMTGQQAGLLLGPVFTISKAVTAISLARQLTTPERPVVPVFWVASQDHDSDEVRHAHLLDFSETLHHLSLGLPQGGPIGRIALQPKWLESTLEALRAFQAPDEFKAPVLESVERCFHVSSTYSEWFARLLTELLGAHGLIVIDPMHPAIAPLFVPHVRRELEQPLRSSQAIETAARQLEARGFEAQLRRTPNSTNVFLEGDDGERRLLKFDGKMFHTDQHEYALENLERILQTDPSRLTPAAGLRPIIADATFPVAVNVLGPGELAYHLELGGVYQLHCVSQPLMHPRLSVTILEPPVQRILEKYDLSAERFIKHGRTALETHLFAQSTAARSFQRALDDLETNFATLLTNLKPFEDGLGKATKRSEDSFRFQLERLERKLGAALLRAEDLTTGQFTRLEKHLLPDGAPQERTVSFLEFVMKFGDVPLKRLLSLEPSGTHWVEL
jgi:bacillithiol synthase